MGRKINLRGKLDRMRSEEVGRIFLSFRIIDWGPINLKKYSPIIEIML